MRDVETGTVGKLGGTWAAHCGKCPCACSSAGDHPQAPVPCPPAADPPRGDFCQRRRRHSCPVGMQGDLGGTGTGKDVTCTLGGSGDIVEARGMWMGLKNLGNF